MYTVLDYNINLGAYPDPNYLTTNTTFAAEKLAEFREFGTGPYTISTGNSACFLPLPLIAPKTYTSIIAQSRRAPASSYLRHNTDPAVIAGFTKQKQLLLAAFATNSVAVDEFIVNGDLIPLFALQKPLSRGFVEIASANPFAPPLVQHRTISDPTDLAVFVEMVKHARRFFASSGLAQFTPVETKPGVEVVSDKALREAVVEAMTPTFDHPSCSCPMMPRELGGVVDPLLRVYGVGRLRIVDARWVVLLSKVGAAG